VRVLHRNHLLPVSDRLQEPEEPELKSPLKSPLRQNVNHQGKGLVGEAQHDNTSSSETSDEERVNERPVRKQRMRKKPERLRYDRLGSPGVDRSKDGVLSCIFDLLEQQQVLISMLSSVVRDSQK